MSRYSMTWDEVHAIPLVRLMALVCVAKASGGMQAAGPDYGERAYMARMNQAMAQGLRVPPPMQLKITKRRERPVNGNLRSQS